MLALLGQRPRPRGGEAPAWSMGPAAARGRRRPGSTSRHDVARPWRAPWPLSRGSGPSDRPQAPRRPGAAPSPRGAVRRRSLRGSARPAAGAPRTPAGPPPPPPARGAPRPELPDRGRRQAHQLIRRPPHAVLLGDRHAEPRSRIGSILLRWSGPMLLQWELSGGVPSGAAALDDRQAVGGVVPGRRPSGAAATPGSRPVPGELVGVDQPPGGHGPGDQPLGDPSRAPEPQAPGRLPRRGHRTSRNPGRGRQVGAVGCCPAPELNGGPCHLWVRPSGAADPAAGDRRPRPAGQGGRLFDSGRAQPDHAVPNDLPWISTGSVSPPGSRPGACGWGRGTDSPSG